LLSISPAGESGLPHSVRPEALQVVRPLVVPRFNTLPAKRLLDLLVSATLLIFFAPLFLLLAVAVALDSPGPVFYHQIRVGQNRRFSERRRERIGVTAEKRRGDRRRILSEGQLFSIHKFRTMIVGAEDGVGPVWALERDPRVTRVGRWMRLARVDELPQLWNVLKGEMSLVGPRPERPHFVGRFAKRIPNYTDRLRALPGITGLAQVLGSYDACEEDVQQKLGYDLRYISNCRISEDMRILFQTVQVVLTRKGAR
jgi:lipopolysaccharide/colanic/teichoic acid biosynthesis glycosyltransferase